MKTKDQHIIQSLSVEIESNSLSRAEEIKLNSSAFIERNVLSIVEAYIANLENKVGDATVQLDSLSLAVDFEEGNIAFLEVKSSVETQLDAIFDPIIYSLKTKEHKGDGFEIEKRVTQSQVMHGEVEMLSPSDRKVKSVVYFIETGRAPWWIKTHDELRALLQDAHMITLLEENNHFLAQLKRVISSPIIRKRLIQQFSDKVIVAALIKLDPLGKIRKELSQEVQKQKFEEHLTSLATTDRLTFLELALNQLIIQKNETISIVDLDQSFDRERVKEDLFELLLNVQLVDLHELEGFRASQKRKEDFTNQEDENAGSFDEVIGGKEEREQVRSIHQLMEQIQKLKKDQRIRSEIAKNHRKGRKNFHWK